MKPRICTDEHGFLFVRAELWSNPSRMRETRDGDLEGPRCDAGDPRSDFASLAMLTSTTNDRAEEAEAGVEFFGS